MERELKFELASDQASAIRQLTLLRNMQVEPPHEERLESEYFDTPDLLLRHSDASLRIRRIGDRYIQTLKSSGERRGGFYEREEYETALPDAQPDLDALLAIVPKSSPLAQLLKEPSLASQLTPVFRTTVSRMVWQLKPSGGDEIELALDTGSITAAEHDEVFTELELELKRGEPRHLGKVALDLIERVPLSLSLRSKSDRGYDLLVCEKQSAVTAKRIALTKKDTVNDAFCKIVQNCLAQVHANAPYVAAGQSPESVHQMRVGLRRLRSALAMFASVVDLPAALQGELKWIADELGKSRDWEVLAHSTLPQVRATEQQQEDMKRTILAAAHIARARREDAARAVSSPRYARLTLALDDWIAAAPWREAAAPEERKQLDRRAHGLAASVLRKRHRKLVQRGEGLHKLDAPHRHRARIAAKKLRYATEFFATLFERKTLKQYRSVLARLQDDLGWGNDMAMADKLLDHLQRHHSKAASGASYARGFLAARVADDRHNQKRLWKQFRRAARPH
ncbi:Inorganic triphosphatase YgiF, contains CYTH and CHAD domains [Cupriavidus sp. YR651]|uniref:CYTH and CHAD domain-containing protein n=1 Tax=Cupriavidus sp. YR651 TaxID=1855315 RepID=UPI00088EBDF6|nr:CYTH and CHAD domain-containing protein [Cupriavidus sp. YR651]SDD82528.1 Inorganic triphosphatase YgiF, contains CYTH and CHAD domains [Cupriavidus sp. YR651]